MPQKHAHRYRRQRNKSGADRAFVQVGEQRRYLGAYGSPESRQAYERHLAELNTTGSLPPVSTATLTVNELVARFWGWAEQHYRKPNGQATSEQTCYKAALRWVMRLYGRTSVIAFGPLALKACRTAMIDAGLSRGVVNQNVGRIRRVFKWGVSNEIVPSSVLHGLQSIAGLQRGRSAARETEPVKPVPEAFVDAIQPYVSREVWAMIQVQSLTGCRPGEAVIMRACDIDMTGRLWAYRPSSHKTEHHGRDRVIYMGPRSQNVVREFLTSNLEGFLFSPMTAETTRNAEKCRNRQSPMTPSHRRRAEKSGQRERTLEDHYTTGSYGRAVARACDRADAQAKRAKGLAMDSERIIPRWSPNRLRHNCATRLRREFGIEAARVVLGHASSAITEVYAEIDQTKAADVMARIG